jgi:hypothetical protein
MLTLLAKAPLPIFCLAKSISRGTTLDTDLPLDEWREAVKVTAKPTSFEVCETASFFLPLVLVAPAAVLFYRPFPQTQGFVECRFYGNTGFSPFLVLPVLIGVVEYGQISGIPRCRKQTATGKVS